MKKPYAYLLSGDGPKTDMNMLSADLATVFKDAGTPSPVVAYVGAANLDNAEFFEMMEPLLTNAGAEEVSFIQSVGKSADVMRSRELLRGADVVFLSGGEPEDGMIWLSDSALDILLRELFFAGVPFVGLSAGSIMMGQHWVHWEVEGDDNTASLIDCLGFIPHTFDAHGEAQDWRDLRCAVDLLGANARGYGLVANGFYTADTKGTIISHHDPCKEITAG